MGSFSSQQSLFMQALIWIPLLIIILRIVDGLKSGKSLRSQVTTYHDGSEINLNLHTISEEDEDVAEERKKVSDPPQRSRADEVCQMSVIIYYNSYK